MSSSTASDEGATPPAPPALSVPAEAAALVARILAEGPLTMRGAAQLLGPRAGGRVRHPVTVTGYCVHGLRGVRLEGFHGPDGWITSEPALRRFLARLHAASPAGEGGAALLPDELAGHLAGDAQAAVDAAECARLAREHKEQSKRQRQAKRPSKSKRHSH